MIGYVMVGTNNLDAAIKFYDEVLEVIGLSRNETVENDYAAYGKKDTNEIEFYITKPFNKKEATFGNGTQISCLLYTSPSPRDISGSRMPSSA